MDTPDALREALARAECWTRSERIELCYQHGLSHDQACKLLGYDALTPSVSDIRDGKIAWAYDVTEAASGRLPWRARRIK